MARLCELWSQARRVTRRSGCGHDRIDPGVDHGPVSGCAADGGVGSRVVSQVGSGSRGERSAHRAVCRVIATGNWIGESTSNREEGMKDGMKHGMTVEQIIASYDDTAPLTEASTIRARWYVDARIAELERQTVFSRTWQVMGRVDQVEKPGQFVTSKAAGGA